MLSVDTTGGTTTLSGGTATAKLVLGTVEEGSTGDEAKFQDGDGNPIRVKGIANGVEANDAVNVSQLNENANAISENSRDIDRLERGVAAALALDVFLPDPGKQFRVNLGAGHFRGATALALTGTGRIVEDVGAYLGVGCDTSFRDCGYKAGVSFQW